MSEDYLAPIAAEVEVTDRDNFVNILQIDYEILLGSRGDQLMETGDYTSFLKSKQWRLLDHIILSIFYIVPVINIFYYFTNCSACCGIAL